MEPSAVKLREYDRLFLGSNQENGYENPILGFTANTVQQILKNDQETFFHYPIIGKNDTLSGSELVNNGAIPGWCPAYSDRIYKKMADYGTYTVHGSALPEAMQTGIWLCSWLSGNIQNPEIPPVWKDRWFNPGRIDENTALYIQTTEESGIIYDINSQMLFEPGSYYKYFHIGSNTNLTFINQLTTLSSLKLHIDDWNINNTLDLSPYNNTILLENNPVIGVGVNDKEDDTFIVLDGNEQYVNVLYNSSYNLSSDMTYSIWAYSSDWTNKTSETIIGNEFRSGWSLKYNTGFNTPILPIPDKYNGNILLINKENSELFSKNISTVNTRQTTNDVSLALDDELYTWLLEKNDKYVYQMDYNGNILNGFQFSPTSALKDIVIDEYNNKWVLLENTLTGLENITNDYLSANVLSPNHYYNFNNNTYNYNFSALDVVTEQIEFSTDRFNNEKGSIYLNGGDQYIQLTTSNSPALLSAMSMNFWFKTNTNTIEDNQYLITTLSANTSLDKYSSNNIETEVRIIKPTALTNPTGNYYLEVKIDAMVIYTPPIHLDHWNFFSMTIDRINGIATIGFNECEEIDINILDIANDHKYVNDRYIWIGRAKNLTVNPTRKDFIGQIDDLMIFNDRILTEQEIDNIRLNNYSIKNGSTVSRIDIETTNKLYMYDCQHIGIDNYNNVWMIKNNTLYKGFEVTSLTDISNFTIDRDNNIILVKDNIIYKYDNDLSFVLSGILTNIDSTVVNNISLGLVDIDNVDKIYVLSDLNDSSYKYDINFILEKELNISRYDIKPKVYGDWTGYSWNRKFNYIKNNKESIIQANIYLGSNGLEGIKYSVKILGRYLANNEWNLFTFVNDSRTKTIKLYLNSVLIDIANVDYNVIYQENEHSLFLGCDVGSNTVLDKELKINSSYFTGALDDLRIYNTPINNSDISYIYLNKYEFKDIKWNIKTKDISYLEEIERFFKFKISGSKSPYFNIRLKGLYITDTTIRSMIENIIKKTVKKVVPAYSELYKIIWE